MAFLSSMGVLGRSLSGRAQQSMGQNPVGQTATSFGQMQQARGAQQGDFWNNFATYMNNRYGGSPTQGFQVPSISRYLGG